MNPPVTRYRWAFLSAITALGVTAAVWAAHGPAGEAVREHPYFAISQLVINGCGPALTPGDLRAWLGLHGRVDAVGGVAGAPARPPRVTPVHRPRGGAARVPRPTRRGGARAAAARDRGARRPVLRRPRRRALRSAAPAGQPRLSADHRARPRHGGRPAYLGAAPRPAPAAPLRSRALHRRAVRGTPRGRARRGRLSGRAARPDRLGLGQLAGEAGAGGARAAGVAWGRRAPRQPRRPLPQPSGGDVAARCRCRPHAPPRVRAHGRGVEA